MFTTVCSVSLQRITQISLLFIFAGCASSIDATKDVQAARALATKHLPVDVDPTQMWRASEPLTVEKAIAYAISHDALLQRDLSIIVQRRAEIAQAELPTNPTINGAFGVAVDGLTGAPLILQGMQSLSWLWTRPERVISAEQSLQQAILTAANRTIEIVSIVRIKHVSASKQGRAQKLAHEDASLAAQTLQITTEHAAVGEASKLEVDHARISLLQANHALQHATKTLAVTKLELLHAMGCPEMESAFEVVPMQIAHFYDYSDATLLSHAIEQRLDLAIKRALIAKRSAEIGIANPPIISASFAFNESFANRQAILPGASFTVALDGDAKETVADSKLQQAEFEYIDSIRNVVKEVRILHELFLSSTFEYEINKQIVATGEDALQRADAAYKRGEFHPLQLIPFQRDLIKAKLHMLQYSLTVSTNHIALERAIGGTFRGLKGMKQ